MEYALGVEILQVPFTNPVLLGDNQSVVPIAHNSVFHSHTKHMEIDIFFVLEKIMAKQLFIYHIPALDKCADVLIKRLSLTHLPDHTGKPN